MKFTSKLREQASVTKTATGTYVSVGECCCKCMSMAEYSNAVISISVVGVGVVLGCFLGSYFIAGCTGVVIMVVCLVHNFDE